MAISVASSPLRPPRRSRSRSTVCGRYTRCSSIAKVLRCGFFGGAPDDRYGNETVFGAPPFTLKSERSGVLDYDQLWASCSLLESGRKREVECSTREQPKLFVPKLRRPFAIALERDLACATQERGPISCWNLRDETTFDVPGLSDAIDLQSDGDQFCALLRSGDVHCWAPERRREPARAIRARAVCWKPIPCLRDPGQSTAHLHRGQV
jgi:hypothetical protein